MKAHIASIFDSKNGRMHLDHALVDLLSKHIVPESFWALPTQSCILPAQQGICVHCL